MRAAEQGKYPLRIETPGEWMYELGVDSRSGGSGSLGLLLRVPSNKGELGLRHVSTMQNPTQSGATAGIDLIIHERILSPIYTSDVFCDRYTIFLKHTARYVFLVICGDRLCAPTAPHISLKSPSPFLPQLSNCQCPPHPGQNFACTNSAINAIDGQSR